MIKYATITNMIKLLPYMNMSFPDFDILWVEYGDGRYGYTFCTKNFDDYVSFDLTIKNDFEFELGQTQGECQNLDIEKFVRVFRLGMVALLDNYKSDLDSFIYKKESGFNC